MADCLRKELLYSEKRARDVIFKTTADILREQEQTGECRTLSQLTREAAARSGRNNPADGRWDVASRTVMKAMLGAGVLLGLDGRPVACGVAAQATPVASLADQFEDRTEAFLLETLIERLDNVTERDHRALAHVLFRQFDPDVPLESLEDRLMLLLAQLADRVELRGDRYVARAARVP
jgi:hypothetical protein